MKDASQVSASGWQPLGTHLLRVDDDILYLRVQGALEHSDMRGMIEHGAGLIARNGYILSLVDATNATAVTPEARRLNAEWVRDNPDPPRVNVCFGANILVRTIITMINRAIDLLARRSNPVHFVKDEAAALLLIGEERARIRARLRQAAPQTAAAEAAAENTLDATAANSLVGSVKD